MINLKVYNFKIVQRILNGIKISKGNLYKRKFHNLNINSREGGKKMVEAYCVKCKKKVEMKDGKETKTKRGTMMMKGKCPVCATTVCRIGGK